MAVIKKDAKVLKDNFMMIISGQPGLGKTTLALSAPDAFLLDTDDGISRVNINHRCDASSVSTYDELLSDMNSEEFKAAKTIVIDTGGTLIELMKNWAKRQDSKAMKDGRAMFGVIKQEFNRLVYDIKNVKRKNLIIVFHTTETMKGDNIITRLSCEGSAKDIVWTPADLGCHMHKLGKKRMLGFSATDEYFAKDNFGISGLFEVPELVEGQDNDFLTKLFAKASSNLSKQYDDFVGNKKAYDDAMAKGIKVIESIKDAKTNEKALDALKKINHALTSKVELANIYKNHIKNIEVKVVKTDVDKTDK